MNATVKIQAETAVTIPLYAATQVATCGRKAAALAELSQLGFDVPDGFVIPVGVTPSVEEIERALGPFAGSPMAVRSSGVAEDLADASHAGHYSSFLNVSGAEAVLTAARKVVASASGPWLGPANDAPIAGAASMAVLVQKMVRADAAGVAFSRNPLTGSVEVKISATPGLGDKLLAGETDGDEWCVIGDTPRLDYGPHACLSETTALQIAELARSVESKRGAPQDIEWAVAGERLLLLQARPITVLPIAPVIEAPKGTWLKDKMHFAEPITPFGASTNLLQDEAFNILVAEWGLLPDAVRARVIGHEYYLHMEPDDGGADPPPWWVLGLVARLLPSLRRKLKRSRQVMEAGLLESLPQEWETKLKPELQSRLRDLRQVDLTALDDTQLCAHLDELSRFSSECMTLHFRLFVPNTVGVYELIRTCKELLGWEPHQAIRLVQGLSVTSSALTRELEEIAAFARHRPDACAVIEKAQPDFLSELKGVDLDVYARIAAYLETWGVRTFGSDAGTPNVEEKPELVALLLADLISHDKRDSPLTVRDSALREARAGLKNPELRERFERALTYAELVYPIREDNVLLTDQMPTGLLRRICLEMGSRLARRDLIKIREDAAMLRANELKEALRGRFDGSLKELAQRRKGELLWVRANPGPACYGPVPGKLPDLRGLPEHSRRLNEPLLWESEHELTPPAKAEEDSLGGLAASSGVYKGKVRVIHSVHELHTLRRGEVLVCPTTSAAWMMAFARAGALVTEAGTSLCHTAIVAREHSLPAVVSVVGATSLLKTGDEVTVDGSRGIVARSSGALVTA